jgi:hypothetical protein
LCHVLESVSPASRVKKALLLLPKWLDSFIVKDSFQKCNNNQKKPHCTYMSAKNDHHTSSMDIRRIRPRSWHLLAEDQEEVEERNCQALANKASPSRHYFNLNSATRPGREPENEKESSWF